MYFGTLKFQILGLHTKIENKLNLLSKLVETGSFFESLVIFGWAYGSLCLHPPKSPARMSAKARLSSCVAVRLRWHVFQTVFWRRNRRTWPINMWN